MTFMMMMMMTLMMMTATTTMYLQMSVEASRPQDLRRPCPARGIQASQAGYYHRYSHDYHDVDDHWSTHRSDPKNQGF